MKRITPQTRHNNHLQYTANNIFLSIYTIHQTQNKVKKNLKKILKNFRGSNRTSVRITTPNKRKIYEILGNLQ